MKIRVRMHAVDSASVAAVGYDSAKRELHVRFHNGGRYTYANVPPEKHQALLNAESVGAYLNAHIKGSHGFTKLAEARKKAA